MNEQQIAAIAEVCHEANATYCRSLGDFSQKSWARASNEQRDSAMAGVSAHIENPHLLARQSHKLWCERKRADGWVAGDLDRENKVHPCLVPFEALPEHLQKKDHLFKAIVGALA